MKLKSFIGAAGACALVAGVMVGVAGPAAADPPSSTTAIEIDGSGSDTTQDVMNDLANSLGFGSWNALPVHSLITPTANPDCINIVRPNGSGEGVTALRQSLSGLPVNDDHLPPFYPNTAAIYNGGVGNPPLGSLCFQFARSSSGPGTNQSDDGLLAYVPFARDAVGVAVGPTTQIGGTFTLAQLQTMYGTGAPVTASNGVSYDPVDVSIGEAPAAGSQAIHLLAPQSGSGTRSFFAGAMGFNATNLPPWVKDTYGPGLLSVQEHDGSAVAADNRAIMPYSIAQWLAQQSHPALDRRNGAVLPRVGGVSPFDVTGIRLNPSWHSDLSREVYNVIPFAAANAGPGTGYLNDLWEIFVDTSNPFSLCGRTTKITSWGFGLLSAGRCGNVTDLSLRAYDETQW